jgi:hypothetical protein
MAKAHEEVDIEEEAMDSGSLKRPMIKYLEALQDAIDQNWNDDAELQLIYTQVHQYRGAVASIEIKIGQQLNAIEKRSR